MARLYLVRHAQATFGFENYDQLSELGIKQSSFIPAHFGTGPHALYRGDMLRHKQTAENSFTNSEWIVRKGLNEFDHENIFKVHRPEITDKEKVMELIAAQSDPKKFLENEFETAMLKWMNEEGDSSYNESFAKFKERSLGALKEMVSTARKEKQKEVIAVTSGGVISLLVTHLLGLPYPKMLHFAPHVANTSVTGLLFNDEKISLVYFNNYSHLPKHLVTFM